MSSTATKKKPVNGRAKGANGERALKGAFLENLGYYLVRNKDQVRKGGYDACIRQYDDGDARVMIPFAIEFKRDEKLPVPKMWEQAVSQVTKTCFIPIVIYKRNYQPWKFVLPVDVVRGNNEGDFLVDYEHTVEVRDILFYEIAKEWVTDC